MLLSESGATANGVQFRWLEAGSGPVVLALHGFPDSPHSFQNQMEALAEAGFRVVAPYMRGYFPTITAADVSYERAALASDVLALAGQLSDAPVVLLGHDWGAAAAYNASLASPEKVARLITLAVPYCEKWWNALLLDGDQQRRSWYIFLFQLPFAEAAVRHDDFAFLERLWREWSPGWDFTPGDLEVMKESLRNPGALTAALDYYRHTLAPRDDASLESLRVIYGDPIAVPALYIHGRDDGGVGFENAEGMEGWFSKGLDKHVIPGAGHFVHRERPDLVNNIILEFLHK